MIRHICGLINPLALAGNVSEYVCYQTSCYMYIHVHVPGLFLMDLLELVHVVPLELGSITEDNPTKLSCT